MTTALDSIRALREMVEKATQGSWVEHRAPGGRKGVATGRRAQADEADVCTMVWCVDKNGMTDPLREGANAALICAMHEALPALLAVAEAAEAVTRVRVAGCLCCNREACDACPPCPACALVDALSALARVKGGGT